MGKTPKDVWKSFNEDVDYKRAGVEFVPVAHLEDVFFQGSLRTVSAVLEMVTSDTMPVKELAMKIIMYGEQCAIEMARLGKVSTDETMRLAPHKSKMN